MKSRQLLKPIGTAALLLVVTLFAYKFIAWNTWKLHNAAACAERIHNARAAVNLTLHLHDKIIFQKSVTRRLNSYIIFQLDINSVAGDETFQVSIDKKEKQPFSLFRFPDCDILQTGDYFFIFARPRADGAALAA
ncbi:MAG: hypothetical protein GY765_32220, partial [bacterium]|nr:hypothetical protein [bacterium]